MVIGLADAKAAADRVGPKAATLARLKAAGLPVPDGVCLTAEAYRLQLRAAGVEASARGVAGADGFEQRRLALVEGRARKLEQLVSEFVARAGAGGYTLRELMESLTERLSEPEKSKK